MEPVHSHAWLSVADRPERAVAARIIGHGAAIRNTVQLNAPALRTSNCTVTADNSWFLFGGYSYKVAVSGASAYVELGASGYPLVMPPNQQWLISFYGKCSAASQKFNAGLVTATGTYQVACYTDATAGNVTRFAFPLNLVADNNSAATFRIDIPSSSSDNFWFDGFQFEPAVSNTVNPSPFLLTNIIAGSIIADNISVSNLAALSANMGTLTAGKIQSADGYFTVDCTNELITIKDGAGTVRMQLGQISAGVYDIKIWDASSNLLFDAASGLTYTGNTSAVKSVVAATPDSNLSYLQHGTVYDLHIGGVKVDTLTDNVYARPLATALTTGQVDLSKAGVVNKTLANISDSGSRFAVINAAGQKGVSAVDAANRALIDFSQVGHTNKILDNIDDGTTYVRTTIQSGNANAIDVPNAMFQIGNGSSIPPGFKLHIGAPLISYATTAPTPYYGVQYLKLQSTAAEVEQLYSVATWNVKPGDVVSVGGVIQAYSGDDTYAGIIFLNGSGGALTTPGISTSVASWQVLTSASNVAPAGTVAIQIYLGFTASAANHYAMFNEIWCSINDVRTAGSGATLGDPRNANPVTAAGLRALWSSGALTSTYHLATGLISIALSGTLYVGNAAISYGPSSVTGLPNTSTTYWVFAYDPTSTGGAVTIYATTADPNIAGNTTYAASNGYVFCGKITTVAGSGSTGTGGGGIPP